VTGGEPPGVLPDTYHMNRSREAFRARLTSQIPRLDDYERGVVILVMAGYATVVTAVNASLTVVAARALWRGWRQRQLGPARAVRVGLVPGAAWAAGLLGAQAAAGVWARRVIDRRLAAHAASPRPDPPAAP
jgi:hypothetical protein